MKRTVEQRHLWWGAEVTAVLPGRRGGRVRVVHVDDDHIGFATALALVVEHGRRAARGETVAQREATVDEWARCPRCGREGSVIRDFGTRMTNGKRRTQSWCRECRRNPPSSTRVSSTRRPEKAEPGWLFEPSNETTGNGQH